MATIDGANYLNLSSSSAGMMNGSSTTAVEPLQGVLMPNGERVIGYSVMDDIMLEQARAAGEASVMRMVEASLADAREGGVVDGDDYTYDWHPTPSYDLTALWHAAGDACNFATPADAHGAIGWDDLYCVSAERFTDHEGRTWYRVWIKGSEPDATELHAFIAARLAERGFVDVEVQTKWW